MDSSSQPPKPGPDPDPPAQPPGPAGDATIRTPDGDVTIRTPGPVPAGDATFRLPTQPPPGPTGDTTIRQPSRPAAEPAGDATVRAPNQQPNVPDADATVRLPSQPAARTAPPVKAAPTQPSGWIRAARPALAAASVACVVAAIGYVFLLNSRVTLETVQRQQAQASLEQAAVLAVAMKQELTQTRQELDESNQRFTGLAALRDTAAQREMEMERLRAQLEQKERELVALYKTASPKDEMLIMLQSSSVRALPLAGTAAAKAAGGLILYDAERSKALLYAFNLPALPRGKVYQFWTFTTRPVSAGTFNADAGRKSRYLARGLPAKSGITKFAVSVEPTGGKPQPTGAFYLQGSL